jgi:hypothetical protein
MMSKGMTGAVRPDESNSVPVADVEAVIGEKVTLIIV